MPTSRVSRIGMPRFVLRALLGVAPLALLSVSSDANAQIAGTTARPLPNVLLLVDTSGSMERMGDNSLPFDNRPNPLAPVPPNRCNPGVPTNPNRWGMLLQALTGSMQPYYSCDAVARTLPAFKNEFSINGVNSYDTDYFLPYHRPLTGAGAATACTLAPDTLPGAASGAGVGPGRKGGGTGIAADFPANAFQSVTNQYLSSQYHLNATLTGNACTFEQAADGQLDAARDYIRFGLMTFDNDTNDGIGVTVASPPGGDVSNPFTGQWSYIKSPANTLTSVDTGNPLGVALPGGCTDPFYPPFEVGARHAAAPPWEGRMIRFPASNANLFDIQRTNEEIQKVLLGTRPYGATPIDGMMEDARDYLWFNPTGPFSTTPAVTDPYVGSSCREQFIILLTDGAPNLDLRPSCFPTAGGRCPYNKSAVVADALANGGGFGTNHTVKTFVIGFSVNGAGLAGNDGFPTGFSNCKTWYNSPTGGKGNPADMRLACNPTYPAPATPVPPAKGSTADACCQLNEIAYFGTAAHDVGPYFAETQADLVLSFGRILGGVSKSASTRTLPGYAPAVTIAGKGNTADYIASFIPNARKVWSGEIDRTRSVCEGAIPTPQFPQDVAKGDSYAANTAAQAVANNRLFITVQAPSVGPAATAVVDSARTIRPYTTASPTDGLPVSTGLEVFGINQALATTGWAKVLDITDNTCKRSKAVTPGTKVTVDVPALSKDDCTEITWGFATANSAPMTKGGYDFNIRCTGAGGLAAGFCSISGGGCTVATPSCPDVGEVCVPRCAALGAIYRASPTLVGPPNQFLRDDSYLLFQNARRTRRPTMFVASADGLLHAYKALATTGYDAGNYELWSFIPPAVLPKLASNYPTGQQILLDGTPVVRDTVWDRAPSAAASANNFHSTLVAGMGAGGQGYYALNVTDVDCGGFPTSPDGCLTTFPVLPAPLATTPPAQQTVTAIGPHFLWQLTDVPADTSDEWAKPTRTAKDGTEMVALFGAQSGTPAITTLQVDPGDGTARQIGVAILPGGIDGPPIKNGSCPRALSGGGYTASDFNFADTGYPPRGSVRQWGATCASPVAGRGVTIVRLDTGEILRHFGRRGSDVPKRLFGVTRDTPFDSPIIGTPAVYPSLVGATAQKIFVGDADGTVWRIDVSSPNMASWRVALLADLIAVAPVPTQAERSQPINIPPVLSLDPTGNIVLNIATGDQENIVAGAVSVAPEINRIFSVQEQRPVNPGDQGFGKVRWYKDFGPGERVTGPMTVFDRSLYFATYVPTVPVAGSCGEGGAAFLWGMDYFTASTGGVNDGGLPRWCPIGRVDPITGSCLDPLITKQNPSLNVDYTSLAGAIIPGVTIRAQQSCAEFVGTTSDPALTGMTATSFDLYFGATSGRSGGGTGTPQAARAEKPLKRPLPRTTATVDAWALVVD